jgi:hypothetical protein
MPAPGFGWATGDIYGPASDLYKYADARLNNAQPHWDKTAHEIIQTRDARRRCSEHLRDFSGRYTEEEKLEAAYLSGRIDKTLENVQDKVQVRPTGCRGKWNYNRREMRKAEPQLRMEREKLTALQTSMDRNAQGRDWKAAQSEKNEWRGYRDAPPAYQRDQYDTQSASAWGHDRWNESNGSRDLDDAEDDLDGDSGSFIIFY